MIQIIPNWHPIWVHFAIGLLATATGFYLLAVIGKQRAWVQQARTAARWNLYAGIGFAALALLTGWLAAASVAHDDAAHANMLVHRTWALIATALFAIAAIGIWYTNRQSNNSPNAVILILLLAGSAALAVTGYEGGQNVYEYGLGVQRLPDTGSHDHAGHAHSEQNQHADKNEGHDHAEPQPEEPMTEEAAPSHSHDDEHAGHAHEH